MQWDIVRIVDSTYDLAQKNDVLASNQEDTTRYISVAVADMYSLDGILQNQVRYRGVQK